MISPDFLILAALPFKVALHTLFPESSSKHSALVLGIRARQLLVSLKAC